MLSLGLLVLGLTVVFGLLLAGVVGVCGFGFVFVLEAGVAFELVWV